MFNLPSFSPIKWSVTKISPIVSYNAYLFSSIEIKRGPLAKSYDTAQKNSTSKNKNHGNKLVMVAMNVTFFHVN